jgi:hypothetical protein
MAGRYGAGVAGGVREAAFSWQMGRVTLWAGLNRSTLLTMIAVMIEGGLQTFGVACGQLVSWGFFYTHGQVQWRAPVGIQLLPALIVFLFVNFLPESPRWLVKHGMVAEVRLSHAIVGPDANDLVGYLQSL